MCAQMQWGKCSERLRQSRQGGDTVGDGARESVVVQGQRTDVIHQRTPTRTRTQES
jgi:hypothetical protein